MQASEARKLSNKNSSTLKEIFEKIKENAEYGSSSINYFGAGFGDLACRAGWTTTQHDIVNQLKSLGYDVAQVNLDGWFHENYLKISW